ncbi:MAG: hypothetical protein AAFR28_02960 [Pseudomonadota bacterium]
MTRFFIATGAGLLAAILATSANAGADIHIGAGKTQNDAPLIIFIFNQGDTAEYDPVDAFTIEIDDTGACVADFDADWTQFAENPGEPIYGPNSGRSTIAASKLPTFFAGHTAKLMKETGLAPTAEAAVPYHNCAGKVWATVLSRNPYE